MNLVVTIVPRIALVSKQINPPQFRTNTHGFTVKCQDDKLISQQLPELDVNFDQCFSIKGIYKLAEGQSKQKLVQTEQAYQRVLKSKCLIGLKKR